MRLSLPMCQRFVPRSSMLALSQTQRQTQFPNSGQVMVFARQISQQPLPLTTTFTPPTSCAPTTYVFYDPEADIAIYPNQNQFGGGSPTECFPPGFQTASPFSPAPSICPVGYTVACGKTSGEVTSAICCPSGWPCAKDPWSSLSSNPWPCGTTSALPFAFTGWYGGFNGTSTFGTSTFTSDGFNDVWSLGIGVFIDWQKSDVPEGKTLGSFPIITVQSTAQSSPSVPVETGTPSASSNNGSSSSLSTTPSGLATGAKAGIGVAVGLVVLTLIGFVILLVRKHRRSRAQAKNAALEDHTNRYLPPQLATRTDAPKLEGDHALGHSSEGEKQKVTLERIAELEVELAHLKRNVDIVELP